jgi:hypothetical protein
VKPIRSWKPIEPSFTGEVTQRTSERPSPSTVSKSARTGPARAGAAEIAADADEVDVGLVGIRLRQEAAQEAGDAVAVLGDEAREAEMDEEQSLEDAGGRTAAPPVVDMIDHAVVVLGLGVTELQRHPREPHARLR